MSNSYGRCQNPDCRTCYGEASKPLDANARLTIRAVERLADSALSGTEAQDLFRPIGERDDPSLYLVFGRGHRIIRPVRLADLTEADFAAPNADTGIQCCPACGRDFDIAADGAVFGKHSQRHLCSAECALRHWADLKQSRTEGKTSVEPAESAVLTNATGRKMPEMDLPISGGLDSPKVFFEALPIVPGRPGRAGVAKPPIQFPAVAVTRARSTVTGGRCSHGAGRGPSTEELAFRQAGRCYLCEREFGSWILKDASNDLVRLRPEREHFIPKRLGGDGENNVRAACQVCNSFKSDRIFASVQECRTWIAECWTMNQYRSIRAQECSRCNGSGVEVSA